MGSSKRSSSWSFQDAQPNQYPSHSCSAEGWMGWIKTITEFLNPVKPISVTMLHATTIEPHTTSIICVQDSTVPTSSKTSRLRPNGRHRNWAHTPERELLEFVVRRGILYHLRTTLHLRVSRHPLQPTTNIINNQSRTSSSCNRNEKIRVFNRRLS